MFRRHLLAACSIVAAAVTLSCDPAASSAQSFTPIKPPAVPLITRQPYMNVWLRQNNGIAPGAWPRHWNGAVKALTGVAYIDNKAYLFIGQPQNIPNTMTQTALETTPTQSKFTFNGGGVNLNVDFLSPVRAVQRCWMGCTEAALLHTRGEVGG